jgi:hypothetical protein
MTVNALFRWQSIKWTGLIVLMVIASSRGWANDNGQIASQTVSPAASLPEVASPKSEEAMPTSGGATSAKPTAFKRAAVSAAVLAMLGIIIAGLGLVGGVVWYSARVRQLGRARLPAAEPLPAFWFLRRPLAAEQSQPKTDLFPDGSGGKSDPN